MLDETEFYEMSMQEYQKDYPEWALEWMDKTGHVETSHETYMKSIFKDLFDNKIPLEEVSRQRGFDEWMLEVWNNNALDKGVDYMDSEHYTGTGVLRVKKNGILYNMYGITFFCDRNFHRKFWSAPYQTITGDTGWTPSKTY